MSTEDYTSNFRINLAGKAEKKGYKKDFNLPKCNYCKVSNGMI